ncbi:MAG: T9SS type A sorting domain-containing protein, partial [Bacteriodetes bacterium]|nr:T9SS type A sorting domain-containing protein [Bacteroidota bacterium]
YSLNSTSCTTLLPGNQCTVDATYTPQIPGVFTASVRIPVQTAGFNNVGVTLTGRCAGVIDLNNDTLDVIRVWQRNTVAMILKKSGASSYDYRINTTFPVQKTALNTLTGEFSYTPDSTQRKPFSITFMAKDVGGSVIAEQTVEVDPIPGVNPEEVSVGIVNLAPIPDSVSRDYTFISSVSDANTSDTLNGVSSKLRTVTISGKTLLFQRGNSKVSLNLSELLRASGDTNSIPLDLKELNIIAETIIIKDSLVFKRTNVNIVARELRFEDESGGPRACINIEPVSWTQNADVNKTGIVGFNCGSYNLKINTFRSYNSDGTPRIIARMLAKGGDGQGLTSDESASIKPGNGGNGGNLTVNLFSTDATSIQQFFDAPGGLSGKNKNGVRSGANGQQGQFILRNDGVYDWIHPTWVRLGLLHLRDTYLYEKWSYVSNIAREYKLFLDDVINTNSDFSKLQVQDQADIRALSSEAFELSLKVDQKIDYYGNPFGWAPNLSFEYNLQAYQNEINYSVPLLAFIYQIQNRYTVLNNEKQKIDILLDTLGSRQKQLTHKYNGLNLDLDSTQIEVKRIEEQTNSLQTRLQQRADELVRQAQNNTKRKGLRRVAQVAGAIAQVGAAITGNDKLRQVGNAIEAISNMEFSGNLINNGQTAYKDYQNSEKEWKENGDKIRSSLPPEVKKALENPESTDKYPPIAGAVGAPQVKNSDIAKYLNNNLEGLANLRSSLTKLSTSIKSGAAPAHVVQAELARLKASDPEFNTLISEIEKLTLRRGLLLVKIDGIISNLTFIINELPRLYLSASLLTQKYGDVSSVLDPRIGAFFKDMEKDIRDRLLLYNYYMRKSYEYRFLKSYPYSVNPLNMFESVRKLVDTNKSGTIPVELVDGMKSIFTNDLKSIASKLSSDYNTYGTKREPAPQSYTFNKSDIQAFNKGDTVAVNPYEAISRIRSNNGAANQDLRITRLEFEFTVKPVDQNGSTPQVKLTAEYPNRSSLSKDGVDYVFVKRGDDPVTWEGEKQGDQPILYTKVAESELSLLRSLLGSAVEIQYFALPAANANIKFYAPLSDRTNGLIDDSKPMRFIVYYEYYPQKSGDRTAFITTNSKDLQPTFLLSRNSVDLARRDGHGFINRTLSSGMVNIEAQQSYGLWNFDHWEATDQITKISDSTNFNLSLDMSSIRGVRAVYKGPLSYVRIQLADAKKDSLRLKGSPVLRNSGTYPNNVMKDTVSLISNAFYLDGRYPVVTQTTTFSIHDADVSKAEIFNDNIVKLIGAKNTNDSIRVIARFVDNDIDTYDTMTLKVDNISSVSEDNLNESINATIFPNPTSGDVTLVFSNQNYNKVEIEVIDVTGKSVYKPIEKFEVGENRITLPTANLSTGTYFVKLYTSVGYKTVPFVVKH